MFVWSKTRWTPLTEQETKEVRRQKFVRQIGCMKATKTNGRYHLMQDIQVMPQAKCITNLHHMFNQYVLYRPLYVWSSDGRRPPTSRDDRQPASPTPEDKRRATVLQQLEKALGQIDAVDPTKACTDSLDPLPLSPNQTSSVSTYASMATTGPCRVGAQNTADRQQKPPAKKKRIAATEATVVTQATGATQATGHGSWLHRTRIRSETETDGVCTSRGTSGLGAQTRHTYEPSMVTDYDNTTMVSAEDDYDISPGS